MTKHTNRQYAEALFLALKNKKGEKRKSAIKNFLLLLQKHRSSPRLGLVLKDFEKIYLKEEGQKKVLLETPNTPSKELKKEITKILGENIIISESINPSLLAGVKMLVNDELLIDATAKKYLDKMFAR
mgnify:CR=1 FL=1